MRGLCSVMRREWADLQASPLAQAQLLWLPVAVIVLLWAIFASGTATGLPLAVVDLDQSSASRQLARALDASPGLAVTLRASTLSEAESALRRGEVEGIALIPAGFRRKLARGELGEVTAWFNAQFLLAGNTLSRELQTVVPAYSAQVSALSRLDRGNSPAEVAINLQPIAARRDSLGIVRHSPVALHLRPLFNTREGYGSYLIPAVFILILQQTLLLGVGMIFGTDRERRPQSALSAAGESTGRLLSRFIGGSIAYVALYTAHLMFYLGFCFWLFNIPRGGDLVALSLFAAPFLLAITLFAQALGGWCRDRVTSVQALLVTSLLFLSLAGFAWPLALMPAPLRWLAHLVPSTAGIQGFLRLNQMGATLAEVGHWWWTLWTLCALYAWPAWRGWRRVYAPCR